MASKLPTRRLGTNGPEITGIGWGAMTLGGAYGPALPDEERLKLLDEIYEAGEWNWDSADIYADSEDVIGKWFAKNPEKRKDIFLATKFANIFTSDGFRVNSTPEHCKAACAKSLKRLGVDCIDLYYCHRFDKVTPVEKTVRAMAELKAEGKIKYLGLSECSANTLRRAHAIHPISAIQMEYSPFALEIEDEQINVLKTARELGVAVVAYSPLGRGLLGGKLRSRSDLDSNDRRLMMMPRFSEENFPKNIKLVDLICQLAKDKGVTPAQLSLAWLLAQGPDIIPIPGTTNIGRLKENLGALDVALSKEEEQTIRQAVNEAGSFGQRYATGFFEYCFADTPEE